MATRQTIGNNIPSGRAGIPPPLRGGELDVGKERERRLLMSLESNLFHVLYHIRLDIRGYLIKILSSLFVTQADTAALARSPTRSLCVRLRRGI